MFMSTGAFNQPHVIKGVAAVTCHTQLTSEKPDQFELFDQLFDEAKQKLYQKAAAKNADGIVDVSFNTEVVRMSVAPKFLIVHAYGTVISLENSK
ncbi:heavy metal-binding domain-containing protein [Secundilactobacillus collinoides]|uniref:Heavy metal-binding domain-containing protein n=2 Tax=Secundilactobacillus collinoides TaxID=33960 RepID=A0A0R2B8E4_SECCO|nr:heavy metal-binding domain-containing protein [Secundilactobacillus collinoides]KRM74132.1 hypothetical protein FC82_GL000293 [Secundilactobacillus collinoides DSM 20515 = JCM 1123]KZL38958.1 hypothetical protein TY91_11040 [Secundilactobacillus collinoides]